MDYGWCFDVHAALYKSAGNYNEVNEDVAIDTSVYTHSDASFTVIKNRFLLWCFTSVCSICYGYGILCYQIKYKCCEVGCSWICCSYCYEQPHDTLVNLKTCNDVCQTITFGSNGCWELQLNCVSLIWNISNINSTLYCCCCRIVNCTAGGLFCCTCWSGYNGGHCCCDCVMLTGSNPTNVY